MKSKGDGAAGGRSLIPERKLDGGVFYSPFARPGSRKLLLSAVPPLRVTKQVRGDSCRVSLSYTGSAGRVNASRMMTSCGQRSRNVLAVFSLLFPAGTTSVGLGLEGEWGLPSRVGLLLGLCMSTGQGYLSLRMKFPSPEMSRSWMLRGEWGCQEPATHICSSSSASQN